MLINKSYIFHTFFLSGESKSAYHTKSPPLQFTLKFRSYAHEINLCQTKSIPYKPKQSLKNRATDPLSKGKVSNEYVLNGIIINST